jgi:hypothetical protein
MTEFNVDFDMNKLDGLEVGPPGHERMVRLIGAPSWHEESQKWRALADVDGMLAVVELRITIKGTSPKGETSYEYGQGSRSVAARAKQT